MAFGDIKSRLDRLERKNKGMAVIDASKAESKEHEEEIIEAFYREHGTTKDDYDLVVVLANVVGEWRRDRSRPTTTNRASHRR